MKKYFKKWFALFLCINVLLIYSSGCVTSKLDNWNSTAKQQLSTVCDTLRAGDKAKLKTLLCQKLQGQDNIDRLMSSWIILAVV